MGTSGARAVVVSEDGRTLGEGSAEYSLYTDAPGHAEQDPRDWWRGAAAAVRQAVAAAGGAEVEAIGLSGQMHGSVLLDERLEPVRRAMLWCDSRAAGEAEAVTEELGRERVIELSGNVPMSGFTGPQLRRLGDSPALGAARWVMCAKDYVAARLTGNVATDPTDATGTGLFGLDGAWNSELADAYGVDAALLPPVVESGEPTGELTDAAAAELGLRPGIPVAAGAADNAAAALGSGIVEPGKLLLSVGTSGTLVVPLAEPRADTTGRCHLFRHATPGTWYSMAVVLSAGGALSWWQSVAGRELDELGAAAGRVRPGSDGVVMTPFLSGRRMPVADPHARASFTGMSLSHGAQHLTRAVVEGAAYAMAEGLECIREVGATETFAVVSGGAAEHRIWLDALGLAMPDLDLHLASPSGGAALGAALLGLSARGADLADLAGGVFEHRPARDGNFSDEDYATVASGFDRYRELAAATKATNTKEES